MIQFFTADWLTALNPKTSAFDMIVSNPPYIPSPVIRGLQPEIQDFEPLAALDGNDDGLGCYSKILGCTHRFLEPGGVLLLEIGHDQQDAVRRIARDCGHYDNFGSGKDYAGHDRIIWMHRSK
jgi:release factor glutamine methyltransferase